MDVCVFHFLRGIELIEELIVEHRRWTVPGPEIPIYIPEHKEKTNITAGYVEIYDKYAYATVKGAGHEVPLYQPYLAFYLFQRFVVEGSFP